MDFKDILEQWESSPEGKTAAGKDRFSRLIEEKDDGLRQLDHPEKRGVYRTGKASLGVVKSMRPQAELDLHGVTAAEAISMVESFLRDSVRDNLVKVRIVHGRGLHSPEGKAVLKEVVVDVLESSPYVRSFGNPPPAEGGSGAVWVVLQRGKSESGTRGGYRSR